MKRQAGHRISGRNLGLERARARACVKQQCSVSTGIRRCTSIPSNDDVEGGVRGAVGGILLEPLQWHQLLTPRGWKRLTTEGHTFADAILTVAMAQIGTFQRCMHCVPI